MARFRAKPQIVDAMWDGKRWHILSASGQKWTCKDDLFQSRYMPDDSFARTLVGERTERVYASHLPSGAQITIVADEALSESDWNILTKTLPMMKNGFVNSTDRAKDAEDQAEEST